MSWKPILVIALCFLFPTASYSKPPKSVPKPRASTVNKPPSITVPQDAVLSRPFAAQFEFLEDAIWMMLPPDLMKQVTQEKWDVFAFLYTTGETPPHKYAYIFQNAGDHFAAPAHFIKQKSWTLEIILVPPKGSALRHNFQFFDRQPVDPTAARDQSSE